MFETLEIVRAGAVASIWMCRETVHNAFNAQLIAELTAACRALEAAPEVRVVVLAGRGKSFSAGADLEWMRRAGQAGTPENLADATALANMLRTLAELSKPTLARVHGAALGGGMGLACACDLCVASEEAVFATSEVRLGLIPAAISPYVLRAMGPRQAGRYVLSGERLSAAQALALGVAHEVAPAAALDARIAALCEALLAGGPQAQAAAKSLVRGVAGRAIDDALVADCAQRIAALRAAPEAQEGLSAFLDKRAPAWCGVLR